VFQKIQYKLLLSYLAVLASILGIFTLAVRIFFTHSLNQQLIEKLKTLAQSAANAEMDDGLHKGESDFPLQELIYNHQALQSFDLEGRSIDQQGQYILTLPLSHQESVQIQKIGKVRILAVTLRVKRDNGHLMGYVRASQSLEELDETIHKLDWGLGGGVVIALVLSGVGGVWLTRQSLQPIEQSFQRLKQFTADASHELRSPLTVIKTNVAVALKYREGMRSTDLEKLEAIATAANQMTRLTEDLLLLARTDQAYSPKRDAVPVEEILHNLGKLYQPQAELKQIHLINTFHKTPQHLNGQLFVLGDSIQLTRVFANLIENAIQYTPAEGTVEIKTCLAGQQLYISVIDTGIGIAPKHLDQVFERFWRASAARSYHSGGSGLGLAIAMTIAQNHGGEITLTSQLGIGSCFTVRLPLS
jgi:OmpR-family two-component system manganese-sensing sensor histidine kinase